MRCANLAVVPLLCLLAAFWAVAGEPVPELRVDAAAGVPSVQLLQGDRVLLQSAGEGLWSVALDWRDGWPADWRHAAPQSVEKAGEWTILRGELDTGRGVWRLSDAYRMEKGLVRCNRRFEWHGGETLEKCTLSVRFEAPGGGRGVLLPGVLYHGNPSGAASGRVPVYTGAAGEECLFEEHRFPMPFASFEWPSDGALLGAALHTLPCPAPYGNVRDQWWSMGVIARGESTELALLSGPCASNGQRSVIKAVQPGFVPYPDAWLNVRPGAVIEKTFYLDAWPVAREGAGFQRAVRAALRLHPPSLSPDLPEFGEILRAKLRYAESRWMDKGGAAGYRKYPDKNILVMGWCGQADALGYALQVLGPKLGGDYAGRVRRSLDFLSTAEFYDGGFRTWHKADEGRWEGHEPLSQGQAMLNFAHAIRLGRGGGMDTKKWEEFLRRAADFHAARILREDWRPKSTDEAFFIAPLCAAYTLFGGESCRDAAVKAGGAYAARSLSMREPYWGGTLDASCEDKEGAYAALQGFLALYDLTGGGEYLEWARHACDVVLTYTVLWDIDLPAGRLRDHGFKTRGWTVVSPQNQHIDVFGVIIAPYVYRVGLLAQEESLKTLALLMYRSCGQLIDPLGSQGEQPHHTNYAQRGQVDDVHALRGGYAEDWTVFWITAHFLAGAALFEEMGVPVLEKP